MIDLDWPGGRDFAVAYYEWALEEWAHEVESHFSVLRAVQCPGASAKIRILRSLSAEEQLQTGRLFTKGSHRMALEILGTPLVQMEQIRLQNLHEQCWRIMSWDTQKGGKLNRSLLKQQVRRAIEPVLGTDREQVTGNTWLYSTRVGNWEVDTNIEFPGSDVQMSYRHGISRGPEDRVYFASNLNALAWLGVYSASEWSGLSDSDIPEAAAGLALVCRRFFDALPRLLPK